MPVELRLQEFIDDRGLSGVIELAFGDFAKRFPDAPILMDLSIDPECGETYVRMSVFMEGGAKEVLDRLRDFDENGPPSVTGCSELLVMPYLGREVTA